ncbi:hypothetical protein pb186bvf_004213 [Paramecium bursaria]
MKGSLAQLLSDLPVYKSPQKRHHFDFLNKYEKPQAFLFRQDRSGSIKVVEYKPNLDRTMTPMTQIKLPSFQNRKNVNQDQCPSEFVIEVRLIMVQFTNR